jgi:hypothetical protein
MNDECDFSIDDGELHVAADLPGNSLPAPEPAPAPPPRVLIQYRSRGIHAALLPPFLILIAALVITSYQRQARLRPAPPPTLRPKPAAPATAGGPRSPRGRVIFVEGAGTGAAVEPIAVRSASPPSSSPPSSTDPAAPDTVTATATAPSELPPKAATAAGAGHEAQDAFARARPGSPAGPGPFSPLGFEATQGSERPPGLSLEPPEPLTSVPGRPLPPDSPELTFVPEEVVAALTQGTPEALARETKATKEQIEKEIMDEAEQKRAEQANLQREVEMSKAQEFFGMLRRAHLERGPFHDELRRVLRELGKEAGPEINNLCERYGRTTHPDIEKVVTHSLNRSGAGLNRDVKIRTLRRQGLPEPMILDVLANELDLQIRGRRGGPKDRNGVRVEAARILLKYPPPPVPDERSAAAAATPTSTAIRTPATP